MEFKFILDTGFNTLDYIVLIIFIIVLLSLSITIGYRKRTEGLLALTFAGRNLRAVSIAFVMFLSECGFATVTGMAGWAVRHGLGIYAFSLVNAVGVITLGWIFMPVYMASGSLTTVDYAVKRFGSKRIGMILALLMIIINMAAKIAVELNIANQMMRNLINVPSGAVHVGFLIIAVVLSSAGGLYSLVHTSMWQFFFFMVGIPIMFMYSYQSLDSWDDITHKYQKSWPATTIQHVTNDSVHKYTKCGIPDPQSLNLIRSINDPVLPWPGTMFGFLIIAIYRFCIDPSILQFCLSGQSIVHVKYACLINGFFQVLTLLMVVPGFIARVLFTDLVACGDPSVCESLCGKRSGCDDLALPQIFKKVIPPGWRGLVLAAFIGASLTSIATALSAGSALFVFNVYRPMRPHAKEAELTIMAKMMTIAQGIGGLFLAFPVQKIPLIHVFISRIYSSLVPSIVAVYIMAVFWTHVNEVIALRTLFIGSILAFTRLLWYLYYGTVPCGDEDLFPVPEILKNFHDLHFAIFLFIICTSFIIIRGMTQDPIPHIHLYRLTYWLRHSRLDRVDLIDAKQRLNKAAMQNAIDAKRNSLSVFGNPSELNVVEEQVIKIERPEESGVDPEVIKGENQDEEGIQEKKAPSERLYFYQRLGCLSKLGALSNREMTDDYIRDVMYRETCVRELPRQANSLNMMLVLLLLVITFVMGFFT